jgi:hypothetical protein
LISEAIMSRFFALPVLGVVLALVGLRVIAAPAPRAEDAPAIVVPTPAPEPVAQEPGPIVSPAELWEAPAPAPAVVAAPAPRIEPAPVAIEPAPAPVVRTEIVERTVYVPQQTLIYAPTVTTVGA